MYRTHSCGQLNKEHIAKEVTLAGWVSSRRDHGQIIFIDLRDRSGLVQVVFAPDSENGEIYELAQKLREEWVIKVKGVLKDRPEGMGNPKLGTGQIELKAQELEILAKAKPLPFAISTLGYGIKEDLRLKYRYLDLRRERMRKNLQIRHQVKDLTRLFLTKRGFIEVDTPILSKSTPEGARDFLVPSRHWPGKFYALPQSPQQYKQLLMMAGLEKYFQLPRCFRDEDLRADRVLEFDQIDLEMSFVSQEDILKLTEELVSEIIEKVFKKKIQIKPFPRLTYKQAIEKYGSEKPDLRSKRDENLMAFVWILDFPMFEKKEDKTIGPAHHPFTAIKEEDLTLLDEPKKILKIRAQQYDLVLNGYEIFGGSIRTTDPKILTRVFNILGHSQKEVRKRFGHLLEAFEYGVPPHGGIAGGLDRFLMVSLGEKTIREVIPFPTTGRGTTAVMEAPSEVGEGQLRELGIGINNSKLKIKN